MEENNNEQWEKRIEKFVKKNWTESDAKIVRELVDGWLDGLIKTQEFILKKKIKKKHGEKIKKTKIVGVACLGKTPVCSYETTRYERMLVFVRERARLFSALPPELFTLLGRYLDDRSKQSLKSTCHNLNRDRHGILKLRRIVAVAASALPGGLGISIHVVSPVWVQKSFSVLIRPQTRAELVSTLDANPILWLEVEANVISPAEYKTGVPGEQRATNFTQEYKQYMVNSFFQESMTREKALDAFNDWRRENFLTATQFIVFHSSYIHDTQQEIVDFFANHQLVTVIDLLKFPDARQAMTQNEGMTCMKVNAAVVATKVREFVKIYWTRLPVPKGTLKELKFQLRELKNVSQMIKERLLEHFKGAAVIAANDIALIMTTCRPPLQNPNRQPILDFQAWFRRHHPQRRPYHDLVFAFLKAIIRCDDNVYNDLPYLDLIHGLIQCLVMSPGQRVRIPEVVCDDFFGLQSTFTGEPGAPVYHQECCRAHKKTLTYHAVQGRRRCHHARLEQESIWPERPRGSDEENGDDDIIDSDDLCDYCGTAPATTSLCGDSVCEECYENQKFAFD
eukprot:TRINITY_DN15073_c0_g1_i2.p1 TRINITY_DN15073_c0_g1~~TRINITY_DN15073_c0_g1_i2.p1  ORF type:complete len:565 (+),score=16.02 TRINITY_DN15073_c0_g1_i2:45-1739(+)